MTKYGTNSESYLFRSFRFSFASTSWALFTMWNVGVPLWFVTLVTAIPPLAWAWRHRKTRAAPRGFDVQVNPYWNESST